LAGGALRYSKPRAAAFGGRCGILRGDQRARECYDENMRSVTRSYRLRAYPNGGQRRLLDRWLGATRWLWNTALAIRSEGYRACGLSLTGHDLSRWVTQWKRTVGHEWLAEVPSTALTQCLRDQDRAFGNFFAHRSRYPTFKRKDHRGSLRFPGVGTAWAAGRLYLPKLGVLKLAEELPVAERPHMVTLSRDAAGDYYVSFCAQVPRALLPIVQRSVGVDVGISHLATLSTGEKIPNPKHYQARLRYLRQQHRCLARREKGSQRRERQRMRLARAQLEVHHARQHALHALTTRLVRDFDVIAVEDLNVKALARGLQARAIQDAAFGELRRQLTYKSDWYGRVLVEVDGWYPSSKRCSHCQHTLDELRLGERQWRCPRCGSCHDRDINAARNLLIHGLRQLAGCDSWDLRVDARGACPEDCVLEQVLADEARSGHRNRACLGRARLA
jgi:putative transposase